MGSYTILDSRLFIRLDLDHTAKANTLFQTQPAHRAHLGAQLLLYDAVAIPTTDFGIVPILISWFGLSEFQRALEESTIQFLRRHGLLAYLGNGNGINTFVIKPSAGSRMQWWQEALFGENEISLDQQLRVMCPFVPAIARARLVGDILARTRDVRYDNDSFIEKVSKESYRDIQGSEELSRLALSIAGQRRAHLDLNRLPGVGPDQARVLGLEGLKDPVDLVLRVAEINMELLMSSLAGEADLLTSQGAEKILAGKLKRAGASQTLLEGFVRLLDLNGIPDIEAAITAEILSLSDLLTLRAKAEAREFREWLRKADITDARELERLYVASLRNTPGVSSLPAKHLRFALTTAAGALNPLAGLGAGALDNYFVERWLAGYSPKVFFDELAKLALGQNGG